MRILLACRIFKSQCVSPLLIVATKAMENADQKLWLGRFPIRKLGIPNQRRARSTGVSRVCRVKYFSQRIRMIASAGIVGRVANDGVFQPSRGSMQQQRVVTRAIFCCQPVILRRPGHEAAIARHASYLHGGNPVRLNSPEL